MLIWGGDKLILDMCGLQLLGGAICTIYLMNLTFLPRKNVWVNGVGMLVGSKVLAYSNQAKLHKEKYDIQS